MYNNLVQSTGFISTDKIFLEKDNPFLNFSLYSFF